MTEIPEHNRSMQEGVEVTRPTRVLVAEDDPSLLLLMRVVIGDLDNVDATFCTTGEEAIELIAKEGAESFDRIITDNGLAGERTGFDVAKKASELPNPPFVILFTGRAETILAENTKDQLREKGIGLVAGKPLSIDQLRGLAVEPIDQLDQLIQPRL